MGPSHGVSFGDYRFETTTGRLWAGAGTREIRLTLKASEVLTELVRRAGEPVSKQDLFASVWNGTTVSDDALASCIRNSAARCRTIRSSRASSKHDTGADSDSSAALRGDSRRRLW